jgi:hypothetical protein
MNLTALESFDTLCERKGWQMATYLSTVKAVMVRTVAFVDVSAAKPNRMQNASPNT